MAPNDASGLKITAVVLSGIIGISFASILIRFCDDVPPAMIATWRMLIAATVLLVAAAVRKSRGIGFTPPPLAPAALGGAFLALHFLFWISSLRLTSVASSVALVTTNPIFVGLFARFVGRERQGPRLSAGIILAVAGSAMLAAADAGSDPLTAGVGSRLSGDLLALAGAVMASGYLLVGSKLRARVDVFPYVTAVYSFAALFLVLYSLAAGLPFTGYRPASYLSLFLMAAVSQLLGHSAFNWALRHLKAGMVAVTILGEPIGASLLAVVILGEGISPLQGAGMAVIGAAILLAAGAGARQEGGQGAAAG